MSDAFWLSEAVPGGVPRANRAKRGDADYGITALGKPGATAAHFRAKAKRDRKAQDAGSSDFNKKHPRGGAGTAAGGKFVRKGDTGGTVRTIQKRVGAKVDGQFGVSTAAAIRQFQRRHGLAVDGIVGHQTALAMGGRYGEAKRAKPGALSGRDRSLLSGARARAKRPARRARGGAVIEDEEEPHGLREDASLFDEGDVVRDWKGRFADKAKRGGKGGGALAHAVIPRYDGSKLTFGKRAGGSTGARIATHTDGSKWLVKAYDGNDNRVATELVSNAIYREMGARVPRAGVLRLHNGRHAVTYPLLEGKPRPHVFQQRAKDPKLDADIQAARAALKGASRADVPRLKGELDQLRQKRWALPRINTASPEVGKHFMTDALLGNWDVAGLEDDNILWGKDGVPFRVDQGGTLEFRAQGGAKPYGPVPVEIASMMAPGGQGRRSSSVTADGMRAQAQAIAETLTPEKIDAIINAAPWYDKKMRERVRVNMKKRVAWMGLWAAGAASLPSVLQERAGDPLGWLQEGLIFKWLEDAHPRDQHGKFRDKVAHLSAGGKIDLDSKTYIKREKEGGQYRVVRSGQIIKGFQSPEDAVRAALDRSVKSKDADSVGGTSSFKDYNAYLESRGQMNVYSQPGGTIISFGGSLLSKPTAEMALANLTARLEVARQAGKNDKYVQRAVPTLEARHKELAAKVKGIGGDWFAATSAVKTPEPTAPPVGTEDLHPKDVPAGALVQVKQTTGYKANSSKWLALGDGKFQSDKLVADWSNDTYKLKIVDYPPPKAASAPAAPESAQHKLAKAGVVVGAKIQTNAGTTYTVVGFTPDGIKVTAGAANHEYGIGTEHALNSLEKAAWQVQAPGSAPKKTGKKFGKNEKQPTPIDPASGVSAQLKNLNLEVGDKIQFKAGGWTYEYIGAHGYGTALKFKAPNGKTKSWAGYAKPESVIKASQGELTLGTPEGLPPPPPDVSAAPSAPAAPSSSGPPMLTVAQIKGELKPGTALMTTYPEGTVVMTPAGQVAILKPSVDAYTGYVSAYLVDSGQKIEVPGDKKPVGVSADATVRAAAEDHLKKANAGTKVTSASGTSSPPVPGPNVGPPAQFNGVPSYGEAKQHIPSATAGHLTAEEKAAIKSYTGSGYQSINSFLRNSKSIGDIGTAKKAATIKKALAKSVVKEDVWIGRQTDNSTWKQNAQAGKVIIDNGVMSSSTSEGVWNGNIQLHVLIRAGSNALHVKSVSSHPGEDEVLMPPGSLFHVLKREEKGSKTVLYIEML